MPFRYRYRTPRARRVQQRRRARRQFGAGFIGITAAFEQRPQATPFVPRNFAEFREAVRRRLGFIKTAMAYAAYGAVAARTPYRTGRARASWNLSVGAPNTTVRPPGHYPTQVQAPPRLGIVGPNTPIYLTNNLPYIIRLNQGWSKQAPAGFVQAAIASVASRYQTIVAQTIQADGGL